MMRRASSALAACAVVLAVLAQGAAANVVNVGVGRCESDATWQLTSDAAGNWSATMSYDSGLATQTGCKHVRAFVEDDLDPSVGQRDYGQASTVPFDLVGASVAANFAFAGIAARPDAPAQGPLVIASGLLAAQITYMDPQGLKTVQVHRGLGSCGTGCYRTRMIWIATE